MSNPHRKGYLGTVCQRCELDLGKIRGMTIKFPELFYCENARMLTCRLWWCELNRLMIHCDGDEQLSTYCNQRFSICPDSHTLVKQEGPCLVCLTLCSKHRSANLILLSRLNMCIWNIWISPLLCGIKIREAIITHSEQLQFKVTDEGVWKNLNSEKPVVRNMTKVRVIMVNLPSDTRVHSLMQTYILI
jgi:hypothetical protein